MMPENPTPGNPQSKDRMEPASTNTARANDPLNAVGAAGLDLPAGKPARPSPWKDLWARLKRNKTAMAGLYVLVVMYGAAVLAGFIAPYKYDTQNDRFGFHPPMLTRIHFRNRNGQFVRPFVYGIKIVDAQLKGYDGYVEDESQTYPIRFFSHGDSYSMLGLFQTTIHLFGVDRPGLFYLFGSDLFGRDLFSRIMYGSQISLSVGIVGILISTVAGMLVGGISGYFGGSTDF
ncbi:MAG: hypothetical protein ACREDR_02180, partial [Blastocatellia bacterium]